MDFLTAWTSGAFWIFTGLAGGLLAGLWELERRWRRQGQKTEDLKKLIESWAMVLGVVVPAVVVGHEIFVLVVTLLAVFAAKEFARATGLYTDWIFTGLIYLAIVAVNLVAMWAGLVARRGTGPENWGYQVFMATPIYVVAILCVVPVLRNQTEGMLQRVALSVMAFVYFGFFLAHLSLLAGIPHRDLGGVVHRDVYAYVLFLVYGTGVASLAGWLVNHRLGKHPIAARISREATWEGAAGALAGALAWCLILGFLLPARITWVALLLAALVFGIMGQLGDLVMRYVLSDLGVQTQAEAAQAVSFRALAHVNRMIFAAPLFFRIVYFYDPTILQP